MWHDNSDGRTPVWALVRDGRAVISKRRRKPVLMKSRNRPGDDWRRLPPRLETLYHDLEGLKREELILDEDEQELRSDLHEDVKAWAARLEMS